MFKTNKSIYKIALLSFTLALTACSHNRSDLAQTFREGYYFNQSTLKSVPKGSSKEQVIQNFGTPSITGIAGNNVFYYISQTRYQAAKFLPAKIVDRKILAVYFDNKNLVTKVAQYGLKDGKIFDFLSQTTPTLVKERNFITQLFTSSTFAPDVLPTVDR